MILYIFIFYNSIIDNSDHLTILIIIIIIIRELFEIIKLIFEIIKYHLPMIHCYADDSQVYISFSLNDRAEHLAVVRNMEDCIRDIHSWVLNNDLKFNDDKTEFLIIGSSQQLEKLDNISIRVGDSDIHPVPLARNLGCWFDAGLSMASHITKLCASSFYYIYNIRRIRKYLSRQSTEILVHAFITSRLDYCNGLLYELPGCLLNKLQRVQNACARLSKLALTRLI